MRNSPQPTAIYPACAVRWSFRDSTFSNHPARGAVLIEQAFPQKSDSKILANYAHDCRDVSIAFTALYIEERKQIVPVNRHIGGHAVLSLAVTKSRCPTSRRTAIVFALFAQQRRVDFQGGPSKAAHAAALFAGSPLSDLRRRRTHRRHVLIRRRQPIPARLADQQVFFQVV